MRYIVTIGIIALFISGCGDPMSEGIMIGLGTSTAATEATELAQENKTALIAKVLQLQTALEAATTPEEKEVLLEQLKKAEKKQEIADLTASITAQIQSLKGAAGTNNLAYILGSIATVAAGYAGKKQLDSNKQTKAIAAVKIAAKPDDERKVYEALNTGA